MKSTPKAYVLIINNIEFKKQDRRDGAKKDSENLQRFFSEPDYEVFHREDLTEEVRQHKRTFNLFFMI